MHTKTDPCLLDQLKMAVHDYKEVANTHFTNIPEAPNNPHIIVIPISLVRLNGRAHAASPATIRRDGYMYQGEVRDIQNTTQLNPNTFFQMAIFLSLSGLLA